MEIVVNIIDNLDLTYVTSLTFGEMFNQRIDWLDLKGVKSLTFGWCFNQPVDALDLKGVTSLTFGINFNQPVDRLDLKGVTSLTFSTKFNQPVDRLDLKGVASLTFGDYFNQPVDALDLKGVTSLRFGDSFNQPVDRLDLKGVTSLTFGINFNQTVDRLDLKGVTSLTFSTKFNQNTDFLHANFMEIEKGKWVRTIIRSFYFTQTVRHKARLPIAKSINLPRTKYEFGSHETFYFNETRQRHTSHPIKYINLPLVKSIYQVIRNEYRQLFETVSQLSNDKKTIIVELITQVEACNICHNDKTLLKVNCCSQQICFNCLLALNKKNCPYCRAAPLIYTFDNNQYQINPNNQIILIKFT